MVTICRIILNTDHIKDGKYICKSDGYHIADSNGDVIFILKQDNIPSDDSEIETFSDVEYCSSGEPGMNFCYYWKFK